MHLIIPAAIAFVISVGSASKQPPHYTHQSLKAAMQTAHTTTDFKTLALYFEERSVNFKKLSEEHDNNLHRELEHPTPGTKYPTISDRARRFKEYYLEQSRKSHDRSEHFKSLANKDTETQESR